MKQPNRAPERAPGRLRHCRTRRRKRIPDTNPNRLGHTGLRCGGYWLQNLVPRPGPAGGTTTTTVITRGP